MKQLAVFTCALAGLLAPLANAHADQQIQSIPLEVLQQVELLRTYGYAESVADLTALAEAGDAAAMRALSEKYANGWGVDSDETRAVGWLKRAAQGGSPRALEALSVRYLWGKGVDKDIAQGRLLRRRAVLISSETVAPSEQLVLAAGCSVCNYVLALPEEEPLIDPALWADGADPELLRLEAEAGKPWAMYALARTLEGGAYYWGLEPDPAAAERWYAAAADAGFEGAAERLSELRRRHSAG